MTVVYRHTPVFDRRFATLISIAAGFFSLLIAISSATAATLPAGFAETQIAGGLSSPSAMEIAPDGRIFVCLQGGQLRVIKNGSLLATPFVSLTVDSSGERGLLGIAFDPNFATNHFVYVYYTVPGAPAHNRVSRFTANGDVALAGSEFVLVDLDNLSSAGNHNGGAIHFGPDGKLYVAVGENANAANAQTLNNRLGKVLRINSDGSIPGDNPFFNTASGANRSIWAMGLRNPFTFAFQPGTGRMFINDVGETKWEEINDGIAGSNYGWSLCEGACSPPNANFRDPLFQYAHGSTAVEGCAIVGAGFYNPATVQFPTSYVGKYFFGDLCNGWIRLFDPSNKTATGFATGISTLVDIKIANDGSLYYLAIGSAALFRVQFTAGTPPSITAQPADQTVIQGQTATFGVAAGGSATLSYQWQRNQVNISGATSPMYTTPPTTAADNGAKFRCVVTNSFGSATSNEVTLTVQAPPPALVTEDTSDIAIALDSVTMFRDPFALTNPFNFSSDNRTRIMLFATNLTLGAGENASSVTARAEDAQLNIYPLTVEYVGAVSGQSFTEVVVVLPSNLPTAQSVLVSLTWHAQTTNKARIRIK
ncbi:MAG TPA: PQQ-dependent sugar dehydrogenase [Pyrinomonadaceae bacterium]|nr:PQQ-dependent sugar dehydrogenase [Pyrinomonadaceae bacterium]